jgi:hypothetical protein
MNKHLLALAAPTAGILALLCVGEIPGWLLKLECLIFCATALAFGFTGFTPVLPSWVWSQPVRGVVCVYLGVGAMFVPPQFLVSAVFLGMGLRLIMTTPTVAVRVVNPSLLKSSGEIAGRNAGAVVIHERGNHGHPL